MRCRALFCAWRWQRTAVWLTGVSRLGGRLSVFEALVQSFTCNDLNNDASALLVEHVTRGPYGKRVPYGCIFARILRDKLIRGKRYGVVWTLLRTCLEPRFWVERRDFDAKVFHQHTPRCNGCSTTHEGGVLYGIRVQHDQLPPTPGPTFHAATPARAHFGPRGIAQQA